jgi:heat-inducible transcriptional repressor
MVLKESEVKARKDRILEITVEEYIQKAVPVSSKCIVEDHHIDLSSATIRNILSELEEYGYLTHPHTSAGRIPTQKGYRYYVDNLMKEIQLLEEEKNTIKAEYERESRELERLLDKTSQVISNTTHYTTIVSVDGRNHTIFYSGASFVVNYPDSQDLNTIGEILKALDTKEQLLSLLNRHLENKQKIYIGHEMAWRAMENCSLVVSPYQTSQGISGRIAVLGPTRMDYERVVSTVDYFSHLIEEMI